MQLEDLKTTQLPDTPGVYFFLGPPKQGGGGREPRREILYIGRATSLKDRVKSYFTKDLLQARGPQIVQMVERAAGVDATPTDSVLEAIILEANLIKKHKPPYNTRDKDDKSFNYVIITDEDFPQVVTIRGKELTQLSGNSYQVSGTNRTSVLASGPWKLKAVYGPFPKGGVFKEAVRLIRKIFPWRDAKCTVGQPARPNGRSGGGKPLRKAQGKPCFNRQIGLCPGTCTGEISKTDYRKLIQHIRLFFEGKKGALLKKLEKEMKDYARREQFEKAAEIRRQIFALEHIQDVSLLKRDAKEPTGGKTVRVEAYDVAHISGTASAGVMTVVVDGETQPSAYRKFKLRTAKTGSDTHALREILERRLGHAEWPLPRFIVVDGGKAQKNAAEAVLSDAGVGIPVVAVTKDDRHRPKTILGDARLKREYENDILLANSEAHRFAIAYHKKLRKL